MKTLRAVQYNPKGKIEVLIRFDGHLIYMKSSEESYVNQIVEQLKSKGASVVRSNDRKYFRINIFAGNPVAKINGKEIDIEKDNPEEIEKHLLQFYKFQYAKASFSVEEVNE